MAGSFWLDLPERSKGEGQRASHGQGKCRRGLPAVRTGLGSRVETPTEDWQRGSRMREPWEIGRGEAAVGFHAEEHRNRFIDREATNPVVRTAPGRRGR